MTLSNPLKDLDEGCGLLTRGEVFVIHTIAQTIDADTILHLCDIEGCLSALDKAVKTIESHISVYRVASSADVAELGIKPSQQRGSAKGVPWFFINAASSLKHCIVGSDHALKTIIATLQRVWCVLELCCIRSIHVIQSLAFLSETMASIGEVGSVFQPAKLLLATELEMRSRRHTNRELGYWQDLANWPQALSALETNKRLKVFMKITHKSSQQSWNGIWIRALCSLSINQQVRVPTLGGYLAVNWLASIPTSDTVNDEADSMSLTTFPTSNVTLNTLVQADQASSWLRLSAMISLNSTRTDIRRHPKLRAQPLLCPFDVLQSYIAIMGQLLT